MSFAAMAKKAPSTLAEKSKSPNDPSESEMCVVKLDGLVSDH